LLPSCKAHLFDNLCISSDISSRNLSQQSANGDLLNHKGYEIMRELLTEIENSETVTFER